MKKILILLFCFLLILTSCKNNELAHNNSTPTESTHENEAVNITPFVIVSEENAKEEVETVDWEKIIHIIPGDVYTQIDGFHTAPISAMLYKNGNCVNLNVNDPRLIRLLNFYNNEVCCGIYSYSQGVANQFYEDKKNCDFKLEIIFSPNTSEDSSMETSFDKIIVIDGDFFGIRTYIPFEKYSYSAFTRTPLYDVGNLDWLSIFGF